jgi:hypothetical protein
MTDPNCRTLAKAERAAHVAVLQPDTRIFARAMQQPGWRTHDSVRVVDTASEHR